jgi:hypothetical protein
MTKIKKILQELKKKEEKHFIKSIMVGATMFLTIY